MVGKIGLNEIEMHKRAIQRKWANSFCNICNFESTSFKRLVSALEITENFKMTTISAFSCGPTKVTIDNATLPSFYGCC